MKICKIVANQKKLCYNYDIRAYFKVEFEVINRNICKFNTNRSSDLVCENFIYETNKTQSEPVKTENHVMNIVIKGEGTLRVKDKEFFITEGTVFFLLRNETFTVTSEADLEYSYISFSGRRADEYILRLGIDETSRLFEGYDRLIPFWQDSINMCEDGNIDVLSEAVLLYSIAVLTPERKEKDHFISEFTAIIHDNFTDPDLSVSTISEMMGYSPKYFSTIFKKKMGVAFSEYLREMRIKHAIFLIEHGVFSVKNVALLCGYRDALYFSKLFTASQGLSPKMYIEKHLRDNERES